MTCLHSDAEEAGHCIFNWGVAVVIARYMLRRCMFGSVDSMYSQNAGVLGGFVVNTQLVQNRGLERPMSRLRPILQPPMSHGRMRSENL